jgi:MFS family permease
MSEAVQTPAKQRPALVIGAASVGTVFEWYDFYLYGSLAVVLRPHFFAGVNETTGFILVLLAFAAGFVVRPFGALIFGRLGDIWGRKNTFLVTMVLMGLSTTLVGLLPSYAQVGVLAPIALVGLRLVQGLALGGEYGGAATYVAEHAPANRRGLFTSFIQTTATFGLFLSLIVILTTRTSLGEESFAAWGWRIPFLVSALLLAISVWIRMKLHESPMFQKMVAEGKTSKRPLYESFGKWKNLKIVLLALLGLTAGQAVVWYTGQFYALFFLEQVLKVDGALTNMMIAAALLLATPFFVVFGWLSDKIGRKWIIMTGCALAALTYIPLFSALTYAANPQLAQAQAFAPVKVVADPADCSVQFDPIGSTVFSTSCDIAKASLARAGVPYENVAAYEGEVAVVQIGEVFIDSFRGEQMAPAEFAEARTAWQANVGEVLRQAGYPAQADPALVNKPLVIAILFVLVLYVTMVYGPIAAMLVELFPTNIRYTSMSLPYHIGNGWFGGFLPTISFAMVAATGNLYYGLWYPILIAGLTVIIGSINLKETKDVNIES